MKKFNKDQRNYIIVGLCAILVIMGVGYAAFQTRLNINGTSNITSNWDVKITNIQSKDIVGGAGNSSEPTHTDTTATFKSTLQSPGDSISYDVTVTNNGSIDAKLDKITLSDSNNPAIKFETSGIKEGDLLAKSTSAILTVKVSYDSSVTGQPANLNANLTVTLDYSQDDGTGVVPDPGTFTGTLYRWTTDNLNIGDSIDGIETTTDPSTLGKNVYLKHEIDSDNKITASYVCFITDAEHCMQSGSDYYEVNKALLQSQESWFTNNGGSCTFDDSYLDCYGGVFVRVSSISDGDVQVNDDSHAECIADHVGASFCGK